MPCTDPQLAERLRRLDIVAAGEGWRWLDTLAFCGLLSEPV